MQNILKYFLFYFFAIFFFSFQFKRFALNAQASVVAIARLLCFMLNVWCVWMCQWHNWEMSRSWPMSFIEYLCCVFFSLALSLSLARLPIELQQKHEIWQTMNGIRLHLNGLDNEMKFPKVLLFSSRVFRFGLNSCVFMSIRVLKHEPMTRPFI